MDNLEPITRNEMFLNGDDLEPITREEMILAGADLEPITRHEWFLKKYRGGGGGGEYDLVNIPNLPADIASFNDGTDLPMASLKVAVTPYQDLHGYDAPWAGGAGKNKLDVQTTGTGSSNGITATFNRDGSVTLTGTATAQSNISLFLNQDYVEAGEYIISISETPITGVKLVWGGGTTTAGMNYAEVTTSQNVIATANGTVGYHIIRIASGTAFPSGGVTIYPMLRPSSISDPTFAPYSNICPIIGWDEAVVTVADDAESPTTSHEYTIDLDGTRYGGVVDATNGTMTVDRAYVDLGTLTWNRTTSYSMPMFYATIAGKLISNISMLCSVYKFSGDFSGAASFAQSSENGSIGNCYNNEQIFVRDDAYTDATTFKTAMNGVQLVYELATPITVQLAPTPVKSIEGENNISANCGQITEVKYFKKA